MKNAEFEVRTLSAANNLPIDKQRWFSCSSYQGLKIDYQSCWFSITQLTGNSTACLPVKEHTRFNT